MIGSWPGTSFVPSGTVPSTGISPIICVNKGDLVEDPAELELIRKMLRLPELELIATAPDPEPNGAVEKRGFVAGPFEVAEPWALLLSVRD